MNVSDSRLIVLITGATGNPGHSLAQALGGSYRIVGLEYEIKSDKTDHVAIHKGDALKKSHA